MKISIRLLKNMLAVLLILSMCAGISASVSAENTGRLDFVAAGDTLDVNRGQVNENLGTIMQNARAEDGGPAVVVVNTETGTVKRNDGVIVTNQGTVGIDKNEMPAATDSSGPPSVGNFGTIEVNEGTVHFNKGNIGKRDENGDLVEGQGNFGYVDINGGGTVTFNYEGAAIADNHGHISVNMGIVGENYRTIHENHNEVGLNGQQIFDDGANIGVIETNFGKVRENESEIVTNARTENGPAVVITNGETGTVKRNDGVIVTNQGTVGVDKNEMPEASASSGPPSVGNFGTIEVNEGTVHFNKGNIGKRDENGNLVDDLGNFGFVAINGGGTVTINHEEAVIDNNHGTVEVNDGTVNENYRNIGVNNNEVGLNGQETFDDGENLGVIRENNSTVVTNQGRIVDNKGDVTTNEGLIHTNNGKVSENITKTFTFLDNGAKVTAPGVEVNNKTIESNSGSVASNAGFIGALDENGVMRSGNTGGVSVNEINGIVLNLEKGSVETNNGTVYNYGGIVRNRGTGTEYFSVKIVNNTKNTSVSTSGLQEAYGLQWLGQTGNTASTATILLIPKDGYEITSVTGLADNVTAAKNDDGTWTLTVTSGKNTDVDVPEATKKQEPNASENSDTQVDTGIPEAGVPAGSDNSEPSYVPSFWESTVVAVTAVDTAGNQSTYAYTVETAQPAAQNTEVTQADAQNTEVAQPDAQNTEVAQPDAQNTEVAQPDAQNTEVAQADAQNTEVTQPDAQNTDAVFTVTGTDAGTDAVISRSVEQVLTAGTESSAFQAAVDSSSESYNEEFAKAAASALTICGGTVNFGGAFENAEEATIDVPVSVADAKAGEEYTVVLSNGESVTVVCEKDGELVIPFPKDASDLSYVVQNDYASRYASLIESYLLYGEQVLAGRSAETQAFVKAYAEELKANG